MAFALDTLKRAKVSLILADNLTSLTRRCDAANLKPKKYYLFKIKHTNQIEKIPNNKSLFCVYINVLAYVGVALKTWF